METLPNFEQVFLPEKRFVCDICGASLKRKEHLERHKLSHSSEKPFICPTCSKGFKRKEHLTLHVRTHSDDKRQVCEECGKAFHRKDHLQKHVRSHFRRKIKEIEKQHPEIRIEQISSPEFQIEALQQQIKLDFDEINLDNGVHLSTSKKILKKPKYKNTEESDETRPFICFICNKAFKRKEHLNVHSAIHSEVKKHICVECGKKFYRKDHLQKHIRSHIAKRAKEIEQQKSLVLSKKQSLN